MMNIPSSWTVIKFDELNEFKSATINPNNFSLEKFDLYSVPIFPLGKPENLIGQEIGSTKQLVEPDDILISKINPRINRVWKVAEKKSLRQIASSEWIVFRNKYLEPRYFLYYFRSPKFREKLCADVTGVGGSLTRAQPKRVAEFLLPVAPLAEQRRVADKLDTTLARVDALNDQLARITPLLKRFRQSVLAAATSGRLTEDWRKGKEPSSWQPFQIGKICIAINDGPFGSNLKSDDYTIKGVRVIRLENINHLFFESSKETFISLEKYSNLSRYRVDPGDLLFSSFVDEDVRVCEYPSSVFELAINKADCFRLKVDESKVSKKFLMYRLATRTTYQELKELVHGATRPRINLSQLKSFEVSIPPLDEQTEIVRRVEILLAYADRLEARLQSAQTAAERLTPALLAKAFRGELVPQDPSDEPATELLRRLREARAADTASKPKRGRAAKAPTVSE